MAGSQLGKGTSGIKKQWSAEYLQIGVTHPQLIPHTHFLVQVFVFYLTPLSPTKIT
jgi:hypothetical protein